MPAALSSGSLRSHQALRLGVLRIFAPDTEPGSGAHPSAGTPPGGVQWQAEWTLKRNCSLSPRQLLWSYLGACTLAFTIATFFWFMGASFVLPFALVEVGALGLALCVYARHATDRDIISLSPEVVRVERHVASRCETTDFNPRWVRVEPQQHDGSLIGLSGHGRQVAVGRFVRPALRRQLGQEIRWALRQLDSPSP